MTCNEICEMVDLYIDGDLPDGARARVERHILRCPACAFEVRSLEQIRSLLIEGNPSAESSPAFREKMAARLEDAFADVLRPEATTASIQQQWALPFLRESI